MRFTNGEKYFQVIWITKYIHDQRPSKLSTKLGRAQKNNQTNNGMKRMTINYFSGCSRRQTSLENQTLTIPQWKLFWTKKKDSSWIIFKKKCLSKNNHLLLNRLVLWICSIYLIGSSRSSISCIIEDLIYCCPNYKNVGKYWINTSWSS